MGKVKLIRLTHYYIPGPLPKVKEAVFLCGLFEGMPCLVQSLIF